MREPRRQPPPGPKTSRDQDLGARIAALKARRAQEARRARSRKPRWVGLEMALRLSSDIAAGLAVGGGIGYALDRWAGTMPLFLFVMLVLGGATGVREAIRSMRRLEAEIAAREDGRPPDERA